MFLKHDQRATLLLLIIAVETACAAITGCAEAPSTSPRTAANEQPQANRDSKSDLTGSLGPLAQSQSAQSHSDDWFEERVAGSGIVFQSASGREAGRNFIIETVGSGVAIVDMDNDSWPDVFCAGGGTVDRDSGLLKGSPCGLFKSRLGTAGEGGFTNVSEVAGLHVATDYSHGCVTGDLNNDGFCDVYVTCYGQNCLLQNMGDGTFHAVQVDATEDVRWNTAGAAGDVDRDGSLDLFVGAYVKWSPQTFPSADQIPADVPPPQAYSPAPDRLLLNTNDGRFIDVSEQAGIRSDGMAMGVIAADFNQDLEIDFCVANDVVANHLYLGGEGVTFQEVGEISGIAFNETGTPEGSMGIDSEDVNADNLPDLVVTNFELEDNSLYLNLGGGQFQPATAAFRLAGIGRRHVGFGARLCDFDGDNRPDLCIVNGHVRYQKGLEGFLQNPFLLRNDNGTGFLDVSSDGGPWFRTRHSARGLATADLNKDGAMDLVVSSLTEPVAVLFNRRPPANWARLRLIGTRSPATPIGASVSFLAFGRRVTQRLTSGAGYLSSSEPIIQFTLEHEQSKFGVDVVWPSGISEGFRDLSCMQESVLIEGRGILTASSPALESPVEN